MCGQPQIDEAHCGVLLTEPVDDESLVTYVRSVVMKALVK